MTPKIVTSREELVEVFRARRDELNVSHETLDHLSGLPSGYSGKLLAPVPLKNLGPISLPALLGALALGIATVTIVVDPEQVERIGDRWVKRKRPPRGALNSNAQPDMLPETPGDRQ